MITNGSSHAEKPEAMHASGVLSEWQRLQKQLAGNGVVSVDGETLTVADVAAVAL